MTRAAGGGRKGGGDLPVAPSNQIIKRAPPVPPELHYPEAKLLWRSTTKTLIGRQQLTEDHLPLVLAYCNSFGLYLKAELMVLNEGITATTAEGIKKHPAVAVRQDAISSLVRIGSLLGLDPTSYRRLMGGGGGGGPDGENEFKDF
ncbi:phage terminase small subunit P27 family [Aeromonas hydrophila]|uniref:phage terminase small subunit P27 family n=1 Tax=Aeromonas hydrophila TaxID=644 RepID=UPI003987A46C